METLRHPDIVYSKISKWRAAVVNGRATGKPLALIVEDEYNVSLVFSRALRAAGFKVEIVRAGDAAIEWLASAKPDIVVLDLSLPHVAGKDVLQYIRADPRLADTPVVVATAYARLAESLGDRVDRVLFKPTGFRRLRDLAARLAQESVSAGTPSAPT
jgi:CheY-like chemotaxis protein